MKKYIALIVLFLTMLPAFASAQKTINIQGVVTDSNNETQIGVNIYPRNDQSHGTVTDIDGSCCCIFQNGETLDIFGSQFVQAGTSAVYPVYQY